MAEAFVRTIKRDYVRVSPRPDAPTVMRQLSSWFNHYNEVHPHKALDIVHPVSSSLLAEIPDRVRSFGGDNTPTDVNIHALSVFLQDRRKMRTPTAALAGRMAIGGVDMTIWRQRRAVASDQRAADLEGLPHGESWE